MSEIKSLRLSIDTQPERTCAGLYYRFREAEEQLEKGKSHLTWSSNED
jgi:hypothetical protein